MHRRMGDLKDKHSRDETENCPLIGKNILNKKLKDINGIGGVW